MQISRFLRDGERALTHLCPPFRSKPRMSHHFLPNTRTNHTLTLLRMSADLQGNSGPKWTSQRVRETFLEYFKENGHTFGMFGHCLFFPVEIISNSHNFTYSTLVPCCSSFRPYSTFHQCGDESVQVNLFRNCGPAIWFCTFEERCQLPKGLILAYSSLDIS